MTAVAGEDHATTLTPRRWFPAVLGSAYRRALADPASIVVSLGFYTTVTLVLGGLWRAAAQGGGGAVAGYTGAALTWYITASEAATVSLNIRLIEDIGEDVVSGSLVLELLRPASVLWVRIADQVGRALPRLAVLVVAGALLSSAIVGPPPSIVAAVLALPSLVLAITANLLAQHAFAAMAFWSRDVRAAWFLYQKFVFILGGMLLPLEVLPTQLANIARWLPFAAMSYAPGRLLSGHVEPWLLLQQLGWIAVLAAGTSRLFAAGERRLVGVGA